MNETVDPSEWLHASYHKVYPFQMKRIEERNGRYYTASPANIFDYLYSRKILSPGALSSAEFFYTLNESATKKTGYARMFGLLENMGIALGGDKIPGFCPNTLMLLISNRMKRFNFYIIQKICLAPMHVNDMAWIVDVHDDIAIAFEELGEAIEISVDILKKRLDNGR